MQVSPRWRHLSRALESPGSLKARQPTLPLRGHGANAGIDRRRGDDLIRSASGRACVRRARRPRPGGTGFRAHPSLQLRQGDVLLVAVPAHSGRRRPRSRAMVGWSSPRARRPATPMPSPSATPASSASATSGSCSSARPPSSSTRSTPRSTSRPAPTASSSSASTSRPRSRRTPGAGWSTDVEAHRPARRSQPTRTRLDERLGSYLESWRSGLTSTERADRPAAEAAIEGLYRNIGLARPRIVWVASPLVGALAYQSIGTGHRTLTSPYAKGDIGTGANRDFHGLRDPFGFPTYVESAAPERLRRHASSGSRQRPSNAPATSARRTSATIRAELLRRIPQVIDEQVPVDPAPVAIDERLGELLIGSSAEPFSRLVGPEVFSIVAGLAVRDAFVAQLRTAARRGSPRRCSRDSSMRTRSTGRRSSPSSASPSTSPRDGSTAHRERLALRLQLARAAGPWWALDGLAHRQRAAADGLASTPTAGCMPSAARPSHSVMGSPSMPGTGSRWTAR